MVAAIDDVFDRYLKGYDPHHVERFFRETYSSGFTQRPDLTMMGVVSALDLALCAWSAQEYLNRGVGDQRDRLPSFVHQLARPLPPQWRGRSLR